MKRLQIELCNYVTSLSTKYNAKFALSIYSFRFSFHIDYSCIQRYIRTVSTENDSKWNEFLAPAPIGIAVLSQLLICTSHVTDFKIDNIKEDKISLLKHPESFRTTLAQIVNDAYSAFMKAQTNMEKIQSQIGPVGCLCNRLRQNNQI
jgi:hypothetical protein